jgi:spore coat polysaccharide biosynthesis protein SpsF
MSAPNHNFLSAVRIQEKKERAVAFIVARLNSSRLPMKQFRLIGDRPLLQWIIDSLNACAELDEVVIATVAEEENKHLHDFARDHEIPCFWYEGEVDQVTTRLRKAAEEFDADICVLVSGDCPLIYAPAIDFLVKELRNCPDADWVQAKPDRTGNRPALQGIGVARKRAWQKADDISNKPELKEHQFPVIQRHPELFQKHKCHLARELYDPFHHRFSVDTLADLEFMNELHRELYEAGRTFSLPDALDWLQSHQDLLKINRHVHQMGVGEERKKALMIVDAGRDYGYGHLMRCRELAMQVTERLGWPVTFLVEDEKAKQILEEDGIGVLEKGTSSIHQISKRLNAFDLIIFDTYSQRHLEHGWRRKLPGRSRVMVLDRTEDWTKEADLVVIPGVTYNGPKAPGKEGLPRVLWGREYVILRREIRRLQRKDISKDLDVLVYLYPPDQKEVMKRLGSQNGLHVHVLQGFEEDFHGLLARSYTFLSGFGYSFYEALTLGAYPVTWPLSDQHRIDAMKFYDCLGIRPWFVDSVEQVKVAITAIRKEKKVDVKLADGTPKIVEEITSLFKSEQS